MKNRDMSRWTGLKFMVQFETSRHYPDGHSVTQAYMAVQEFDDSRPVEEVMKKDLPEWIEKLYEKASSENEAFDAGPGAIAAEKLAKYTAQAAVTSEYTTVFTCAMPDGLSLMAVNVRRMR